MKTNFGTRWLGFFTLGIVMLSSMISPQKAEATINRGVSFQIFYDELAPYGDWVRDARYGYIWLPAVEHGFHPYGTQGHWVMTEFGNTWVPITIGAGHHSTTDVGTLTTTSKAGLGFPVTNGDRLG